MKQLLRAIGMVALVASCSTGIAAYKIVDLGASGRSASVATDINNPGQIVGGVCRSDAAIRGADCDAFITHSDGSNLRTVAPIGDLWGLGKDVWITDLGAVYANSPTGPFKTGPNGVGRINIGAGGNGDNLTNVSSNGRFIKSGCASDAIGSACAIQTSSLVPAGGQAPARGVAVAANGQMVVTYTLGAVTKALVTAPNGASPRALTSLAGYVYPTEMNNSGQVVGFRKLTFESPSESFITAPDATSATILALPSLPQDVNASGDIVGGVGGSKAVLYSSGSITMLGTLPSVQAGGWQDLEPLSINDSGNIMGRGLKQGSGAPFSLRRQPGPPRAIPLSFSRPALSLQGRPQRFEQKCQGPPRPEPSSSRAAPRTSELHFPS
jgi:hypothetical protein